MAVVSVTRKIRSTAGDQSPDGKTFSMNRGITYQIVVDDPNTTESDILYSPLVVALRSPHPDNFYLRVSGRQLSRVSPILYELETTYASPTGGGENAQSPLDMPPKIRFTSEDVEEEVTHTVGGLPIQTINGETFMPRLREVLPIPAIIVQRNVTWVNPNTISLYRNTVNSDTWYGMPAGTVLCKSIDADSMDDGDFSYWSVTARFLVRRGAWKYTEDVNAWHQRLLAQGFLITVDLSPGPGIIHAMYADMTKATRPVLHDTETGRLITDPTDAQYYLFRTKVPMPFNELGLL